MAKKPTAARAPRAVDTNAARRAAPRPLISATVSRETAAWLRERGAAIGGLGRAIDEAVAAATASASRAPGE
jgi:hypothetical protein